MSVCFVSQHLKSMVCTAKYCLIKFEFAIFELALNCFLSSAQLVTVVRSSIVKHYIYNNELECGYSMLLFYKNLPPWPSSVGMAITPKNSGPLPSPTRADVG